MPAYNEAGYIESSIEETVKTFRDCACAFELIVMDDGSSDDTVIKASRLLESYPGQLVVRSNPHKGKGRAIKKALHYLNGGYTVFLDADMDLHPFQVQTLFDIMRLNNSDIVIGSKFHPNSRVNYPLQRKVISKVYYWLVLLLFRLPCRDTQTGLKLFKTAVLREVLPRILVAKFAFDLEVLVNAHHLGYKITEAPIVLNSQRRYGRIGPRAVWTTFLDTLKIWYRMYILKYYDRIDYYRRKNMAKEFRRMRR